MENIQEQEHVKTQPKTVVTVIATAIATTILSAVAMGIIAPNNLRTDMKAVQMEQVVRAKQMDVNTGAIKLNEERIYRLETVQIQLATKADLQTLKEDLIRELKK